MVARDSSDGTPVLTRLQGALVGVVGASVPAGLFTILLLAWSPWLALTIAASCVGAGVIVGATIGRSLAAEPDPLAVLIVSAVATAVGGAIAILVISIVDTWGELLLAALVLAIPAYFLMAFPGVIIGIVVARRLVAAP